jgi:hypothetical protein
MEPSPPTALDLVDRLSIDVVSVPKGPMGLWGALAAPLTPAIAGRALPEVDPAAVAPEPSMFDYDERFATPITD